MWKKCVSGGPAGRGLRVSLACTALTIRRRPCQIIMWKLPFSGGPAGRGLRVRLAWVPLRTAQGKAAVGGECVAFPRLIGGAGSRCRFLMRAVLRGRSEEPAAPPGRRGSGDESENASSTRFSDARPSWKHAVKNESKIRSPTHLMLLRTEACWGTICMNGERRKATWRAAGERRTAYGVSRTSC